MSEEDKIGVASRTVKKMFKWLKEAFRSQVEESIELRVLRNEAMGIYLAWRRERLKDHPDEKKIDELIEEHSQVVDEWNRKADSYEKRFLTM